jgi:hypothetical protein
LWIERSTNLVAGLALLVVIVGLLVLALPDTREGPELLQLDSAHSVRVADLIGGGMVAVGAIVIWVTVLAWQRRRIQ